MSVHKFTFKKEEPTGQFRSFFPTSLHIKYKGFKVGTVSSDSLKVRLMVWKKDLMGDKNPNCQWKWITLKKEFKSFDEIKVWLNEVSDKLFEIFDLRTSETKQVKNTEGFNSKKE